jgi:TetR/AcrR family transcriptional regulator, repressor for uid operon
LSSLVDDSKIISLPGDGEGSAHDARRGQILDAARRCFASSGFHGASMQQICSEARMSPGALYRYFPSKDAIIEAIAQNERGRAATCMAILREPAPLEDRVVRTGLAYLEMMYRQSHGRPMVEICAESLRNTAVGAHFHLIELDVRGAFLEIFKAEQARGVIPPHIKVELALTVMLSVGDGLAMRMGLEPDFTPTMIEPFLRRITRAVLGLNETHETDDGAALSSRNKDRG